MTLGVSRPLFVPHLGPESLGVLGRQMMPRSGPDLTETTSIAPINLSMMSLNQIPSKRLLEIDCVCEKEI